MQINPDYLQYFLRFFGFSSLFDVVHAKNVSLLHFTYSPNYPSRINSHIIKCCEKSRDCQIASICLKSRCCPVRNSLTALHSSTIRRSSQYLLCHRVHVCPCMQALIPKQSLGLYSTIFHIVGMIELMAV